jgi:hypothetical protein
MFRSLRTLFAASPIVANSSASMSTSANSSAAASVLSGQSGGPQETATFANGMSCWSIATRFVLRVGAGCFWGPISSPTQRLRLRHACRARVHVPQGVRQARPHRCHRRFVCSLFDCVGVEKRTGYVGGQTQGPTYREVCSGKSGHAEACQVTFDTSKISYADLVEYFYR